jgi:hypothetical protein
MNKFKSMTIAMLLVVGVGVTDARAQEPVAAPSSPLAGRQASSPRNLVPLEVEVVISRYLDAKRISSLPYTLAVNANGPEVQLNMGTDVAVPSTLFMPAPAAAGDAKAQASPVTSYNYRSVGTSITSSASVTEDGRFDLRLFIDDSSVYQSPSTVPGGNQMPAFRSFRSRNTLLLRDGQSREYTAATDRVSGEVVKISVTLRVVK